MRTADGAPGPALSAASDAVADAVADVAPDVGGLVAHLFRHQAGRLVAALARRLGPAHLDRAEDVVQEALLEALRAWPFRGVPDDPVGWLFRVAHRRALNLARRDTVLARYAPALAAWYDQVAAPPPAGAGADDALALLLACCHPAVPREAGIALALTTVGGFTARELARAFLVEEATVAQRVVRAKRRLREAGVAIAVPEDAAARAARVPATLDTLYLLFNEGYAAGDAHALVRDDLCREALRLARLVADDPVTQTPAADALAALIALHAARLPARMAGAAVPGGAIPADAASALVLLPDQDRARWDTRLVALGLRHLARAARGDALTRYHLEAEIAAHHAAAPSAAATDWAAIRRAYDALLALTGSPVVAVHRAVAVGMCDGAGAALAALAAVADDPALARYGWLYSTRAHWWLAAGDAPRAASDYRRALALPCAAPVRAFLAQRVAALEHAAPGGPAEVTSGSAAGTPGG